MTNLIVNEEFHSIQGEGPSTGQNAYFVRTSGCNLNCVFCDTPYTWSFSKKKAVLHKDREVWNVKEESHATPIEDIFLRIAESKTSLVIFTGGEPMLQQENIAELAALIFDRLPTVRIEFETAGTIAPDFALMPHRLLRYNVSPKLANSGNTLESRFKWDVLNLLAKYGSTAFKFVVSSASDIDEIVDMVSDIEATTEQVWLMPEGVEATILDERARWLAPIAIEHGYNLSPRYHVNIWGNKRGV